MRRKKKNDKNLVFIVHYPNADETKYNGVKEIFVRNKERIRVAKSECETYTDQQNTLADFKFKIANLMSTCPHVLQNGYSYKC